MGSESRVVKKSSNVCLRCRRQKVKCSGTSPCDRCNKRRLTCVFDDRDQKILVTKGYIVELQQKIAKLQQGEGGDNSDAHSDYEFRSDSHDRGNESLRTRSDTLDANDDSNDLEGPESGLTNPLSAGPPAFTTAANGKSYYLGTSSNWSFTRRVVSLTHEHLYQEPLPPGILLFEGAAYDLGWDGLRTTPSIDAPIVPTLDHAHFLINAVKFRCGQIYHLFDEDDFMSGLHEFYSDTGQAVAGSLWYIHFLVILAFGKGFVQQKCPGNKPPGADLFVRALQMLPDPCVLARQPILSTEILCCISLYCQSLDFRTGAHSYIGQAVRMAQGHGMHTRMPIEQMGEQVVQRCRRIWWTAYILDREMTSLMGLPQSTNDDNVHTELPTFAGCPQRTTSLSMHIQLSRIMADINTTVYAVDGRLNRTFLLSTKGALAKTAGLADKLGHSFPLREGSGISRISAYLHLLYHQCIVLATRPLLFCFLKIRFESPETCLESLNASRNVRNLMQMCVESAQQIISILQSVQSEGLLETFLSFDLESLFMSTVVLLMRPAIDSQLPADRIWLEKAYSIFEQMILDGNHIANFWRSELQQLEHMLNSLSRDQVRCSTGPIHLTENGEVLDAPAPLKEATLPDTTQALENDILPLMPDDFGFAGLTTAQIMETANAIENGDTEWMSNTMIEHSIW